MSDVSVAKIDDALRADARARAVLWLLIALTLFGVAVLSFAFPPVRSGASVLDIEFARTAELFSQRLAEDWTLPAVGEPGWCEALTAQPGLPNTGRLSCQLLFDSLFLVPGYTGLLIFFTLGLTARAGLRGALPHALCMPALAAAMFDLAENGMTVRAADHLLFLVLADAAVQDVYDAALVKWWMLAIAAGVVGGAALAAANAGSSARWVLVVGAALMATSAVALGVGLSMAQPPRPMVGATLFTTALFALVIWRLLQPRKSQ
jgi:hypothetical protein